MQVAKHRSDFGAELTLEGNLSGMTTVTCIPRPRSADAASRPIKLPPTITTCPPVPLPCAAATMNAASTRLRNGCTPDSFTPGIFGTFAVAPVASTAAS